MKIKNNTKLTSLITLIFLSGCATNADWGKYRGEVKEAIDNTPISHAELNSNLKQIEQEAQYLDISIVNYLHKVNTNKIKRVTPHDLLPDPFLVKPTQIIPRRTAQNKSFDWKGGVSNVHNAKYEIRLQNGADNELLYLSPSLEEARQYVRKYMPFHDDLYVYEKATGRCVYAPGNTFNAGWAKFE